MIRNSTKSTVLSENKVDCCSAFSKSIGLMFSRKPRSLVFHFEKEQINAIHMIFVFFPIDILFIDSKKRVVELKENLRPFSFYSPINKSRYVIEVPGGTVKSTSTAVGDVLGF